MADEERRTSDVDYRIVLLERTARIEVLQQTQINQHSDMLRRMDKIEGKQQDHDRAIESLKEERGRRSKLRDVLLGSISGMLGFLVKFVYDHWR